MNPIEHHYETLLAPHYTWMSGGLAARLADNRALFETLALTPGASRRALDLGCGSGFQTLALRERGFAVTGVDLSPTLLAELRAYAGADAQIHMVHGDITHAQTYAAHVPFDLAVCMGDTLSHLPDEAAVTRLFAGVAAALVPGGSLLLRYRNLSRELTGADRIIPVQQSADRIFTCFLEYTPTHVNVHDVLHTRDSERWVMHKNAYQKIRIAPERVNALLAQCGLGVSQHSETNGLITTLAKKQSETA